MNWIRYSNSDLIIQMLHRYTNEPTHSKITETLHYLVDYLVVECRTNKFYMYSLRRLGYVLRF